MHPHHPTCPGGCGELADECACKTMHPLGKITFTHRDNPRGPHPFEPSGNLVGRSRVEACGWCGLAQRGPGTIHPND